MRSKSDRLPVTMGVGSGWASAVAATHMSLTPVALELIAEPRVDL